VGLRQPTLSFAAAAAAVLIVDTRLRLPTEIGYS